MKKKHQKLSNYEAERNMLIPKAERYADSVMGKEPANTSTGYRRWADNWNICYHSKMKELARGL